MVRRRESAPAARRGRVARICAAAPPDKTVTAVGTRSPWYPRFKAVVFALLACNTAYYLLGDTWTKALDALAWLTLLALFALETGSDGRLRARGVMAAIRGLRLAAAAAVGAAAIGYAWQNEWLDAVNTALWIAVVVLLEFEVRSPRAVARHRRWFTATAATLYAGLGTLVLAWAWRAEWFDAYDAALWLTAFAMIEMDVLRGPRRGAVD